jgi:hypothetical protein
MYLSSRIKISAAKCVRSAKIMLIRKTLEPLALQRQRAKIARARVPPMLGVSVLSLRAQLTHPSVRRHYVPQPRLRPQRNRLKWTTHTYIIRALVVQHIALIFPISNYTPASFALHTRGRSDSTNFHSSRLGPRRESALVCLMAGREIAFVGGSQWIKSSARPLHSRSLFTPSEHQQFGPPRASINCNFI